MAQIQMTKPAKNPKVDWYFGDNEKWEKPLRKLRTIAL